MMMSDDSPKVAPEDEFSAAMDAILQALVADAAMTLDPTTAAALVTIIHRGPEDFHTYVLFPWNQAIGAAVVAAFPNQPPEHVNPLTFLYQHADFVWRHLERLFERFEGFFACADKARWVLACYLVQCQGQPLPAWPPEPRQYWHPRTQSLTFWLQVVRHLERLYYGDLSAYLEDLVALTPTPTTPPA